MTDMPSPATETVTIETTTYTVDMLTFVATLTGPRGATFTAVRHAAPFSAYTASSTLGAEVLARQHFRGLQLTGSPRDTPARTDAVERTGSSPFDANGAYPPASHAPHARMRGSAVRSSFPARPKGDRQWP
ncbi:hypothetical protein IU487_19180 [Nocardia puris]|uniref:hypothetical protein n=1 Tax=Nocardia puris TaxID=208602 RepID=UPI001895DC47|nr:hypothetical protein [Nocardia puris]MBF6213149.1 hypothetical protein [Nocardia puris]